MSITIKVNGFYQVEVGGTVVQNLGAIGGKVIALGEGTVLSGSDVGGVEGAVWALAVERQGTASVQIEDADPEGDPATFSAVATIEGQVPYIALVDPSELFDGVPPTGDPLVDAVDVIREGVLARHNAAALTLGHTSPSWACTGELCGTVRTWRASLAGGA